MQAARKKSGTTDRALMAKYQKHYADRDKFMVNESTGFVWLYVRK